MKLYRWTYLLFEQIGNYISFDFQIVEKKGAFACAVYFEPDCASYKTSPIKLYVEGVECQVLKCVSMFSKPSVYFLDPKLNVGILPFGLSTLRKAVMFNADFTDVMFVVLNESPATGVTVRSLLWSKSVVRNYSNIKI